MAHVILVHTCTLIYLKIVTVNVNILVPVREYNFCLPVDYFVKFWMMMQNVNNNQHMMKELQIMVDMMRNNLMIEFKVTITMIKWSLQSVNGISRFNPLSQTRSFYHHFCTDDVSP